jgi:solute carrier family 4 anion exchanger 2
MVFDEALYKFTKNAEVEFLTTRVWIAIWCAIIALAVAAFQGSVVVRYYTKFTKDIFIAFVASVFIIEALLQTAGVSFLQNKFVTCILSTSVKVHKI